MDTKTVGALVFWAFALFTAIPAIAILFVRDVIRCAVLLLATLSGVAGLFVLLGADFLGFVQVLVYIGGILILLMYGVMLTERDPVLLSRVKEQALVAPALIAAIFILLPVFYVSMQIAGPTAAEVGADGAPAYEMPHPLAHELPAPETSARGIGQLLMTDFILPFEVISLLLLAALIGAAYIARMEQGEPGEGGEDS